MRVHKGADFDMNNVDVGLVKDIYAKMGDDISKEIFGYRLMYSLTNDWLWVNKLIESSDIGLSNNNMLREILSKGKPVLYGTGVWGRNLIRLYGNECWNYAVDKKPKASDFMGVIVKNYDKFLAEYSGETIVISPRVYHKEICEQLIESGIPKEKIYNFGEMDQKLVDRQYFDLPYLEKSKEEIFVDGGCFDGYSSLMFKQWVGHDNYSCYAFEPDSANKEKCDRHFIENDIKGKVIPKGLWDKEEELKFNAINSGGSAINSSGTTVIKTGTIDIDLKDVPVSFIKMDIEGAEKEAILGAKNTIIKFKPKCAISIYHKPEDIVEICRMLLEYNPSYKLYLRHYSLFWYDTVLYAI